MTESIITGAVAPTLGSLSLLSRTWKLTAETAAEGPVAAPEEPVDEESGLFCTTTVDRPPMIHFADQDVK